MPGGEGAGLEAGIDYTVGATPLGGFLSDRSVSALIRPAELRLAQNVITIRRWSRLGASSTVEHLPVSKVAMVRLVRGIFSSGILLEPATLGPALVIFGLRAAEARAMVSLLEQAVAVARRNASPAPSSPGPAAASVRPSEAILGH